MNKIVQVLPTYIHHDDKKKGNKSSTKRTTCIHHDDIKKGNKSSTKRKYKYCTRKVGNKSKDIFNNHYIFSKNICKSCDVIRNTEF